MDSTKGQKAIEQALDHFSQSKSNLHHEIKLSLEGLLRSHRDTFQWFIQRHENRLREVEKEFDTKMVEAEAQRMAVLELIAFYERSGLNDDYGTNQNSLIFAENLIEELEKLRRHNWGAAEALNNMEKPLWNWYDNLVVFISEGVVGDKKLDVILQLMTNGVLIAAGAGALGAPLTVIATAVAAIQAMDITERRAQKITTEDQSILQLEKYLLLIKVIVEIGANWQKIGRKEVYLP